LRGEQLGSRLKELLELSILILARVVHVFRSAPASRVLFANRRDNRMKVLVQDGIGVLLAARRLNQGKFTNHIQKVPTIPRLRIPKQDSTVLLCARAPLTLEAFPYSPSPV
jgi:hypothetical protein